MPGRPGPGSTAIDRERRDVRVAVRVGVVDEEARVLRVVRVEREAEETLLAAAADLGRDVEERVRRAASRRGRCGSARPARRRRGGRCRRRRRRRRAASRVPPRTGSIVTATWPAGSSAPAGADPAGEAVGWPEPLRGLQASAATMATPSARQGGDHRIHRTSRLGSRFPTLLRSDDGSSRERVFVGRAAELAALDDALETAAAGRTTTVLIGGDAGVGKSRLLAGGTNGLASEGPGRRRVLHGCGEGGPAFAAGRPGPAEAVQLARGRPVSRPSSGRIGRHSPDSCRSCGTALGCSIARANSPVRSPRRVLFQRMVDVLDRAADGQAARARARGPSLGGPVDAGIPRVPGL